MTYQVFVSIMLVSIYLGIIALCLKDGLGRISFITCSLGLFSILMIRLIIGIIKAIQQM